MIDKKENSSEKKKVKSDDNYLMFRGKMFKASKRNSKYIKKDNIKRIIYKCIYNRHEEKLRAQMKEKSFCNATIIYILPNQKKESGYTLKVDHSLECNKLFKPQVKKNLKQENEKKNFFQLCDNYMNNSDIDDRRILKEKFKEIYINNKFTFPLNNYNLANIISRWENNMIKSNKSIVLNQKYDCQNRLILQEYKIILMEDEENQEGIYYEYIIWGNEENISRIRKSKYFYIDTIHHHPYEFKQMLVLLYKDIETGEKIPGLFILINYQNERMYNMIFDSINNILTSHKQYYLKLEIIITDNEEALLSVIKKFFPNIRIIICYFHYKKNIIKNLRSYDLYKNKFKNISNIVLKILCSLPFKYEGNINFILNTLGILIKNYPQYQDFINNYFIKTQIQYFTNCSLNYKNIPEELQEKNFLDNYNCYIKSKLEKNKIINWVKFINFIKNESVRAIDILQKKSESESKNKNNSEKMKIENESDFY